jgi:AcrR family transcriptional regulator
MGRIKNFQIDPEKLLDCVYEVVGRLGFAKVTLDAVAQSAGVSKGGLMHHFPTKNALFAAIMRRESRKLLESYQTDYAALPPGPGRAARALLTDLESYLLQQADILDAAWDQAMLIASAEDPQLLEPLWEVMRVIIRDLENDGLEDGIGWVILAAVEGLFYNRSCPHSFSAEQVRKVVATLRRLTGEEFLSQAGHPVERKPGGQTRAPEGPAWSRK